MQDVLGKSISVVFVIQILNAFTRYAPTLIAILQIVIALLTIIYLFKKIKHFKP